jgi:hypothetical protein
MFAAPNPEYEPMPETSPEQKADPKTVTSEESGFESAEESLALKTEGQRESPDLSGFYLVVLWLQFWRDSGWRHLWKLQAVISPQTTLNSLIKWLIMQTMGISISEYFRVFWLWSIFGISERKVSGCHPGSRSFVFVSFFLFP